MQPCSASRIDHSAVDLVKPDFQGDDFKWFKAYLQRGGGRFDAALRSFQQIHNFDPFRLQGKTYRGMLISTLGFITADDNRLVLLRLLDGVDDNAGWVPPVEGEEAVIGAWGAGGFFGVRTGSSDRS